MDAGKVFSEDALDDEKDVGRVFCEEDKSRKAYAYTCGRCKRVSMFVADQPWECPRCEFKVLFKYSTKPRVLVAR